MEAAEGSLPRRARAPRTGPSHAPALLVYLLTCPADKLFLGVVCLAAVVAVLMWLEWDGMLGGLDSSAMLKAEAFMVYAFASWEEASQRVNASHLRLEEALKQDLITRSVRTVVMDPSGRILMGRRDAPGSMCFESYQVGVSSYCGAVEDLVACALRALEEESGSSVQNFQAYMQGERQYRFVLDDGSVHRELTGLACVWLPPSFRWTGAGKLSWRFDKPVTVQMKLSMSSLWCSEDFRQLMEEAHDAARRCHEQTEMV
ncbi:unnamed protein product [Effrenium voratum]|uniref:Nudix hydrolase domain-containing protein n=1 Tax=Effrenium voratum TaxID=2562239 RepID=A0AA36HM37_9DINO|nr:unnamed protein product [Effrenium voratum]CAJ1446276.1 unnamed protein product [Effrenium voratum]